jgi:hypothetical protein
MVSVKGSNSAVAMVELRPGMAPTSTPATVPASTTPIR